MVVNDEQLLDEAFNYFSCFSQGIELTFFHRKPNLMRVAAGTCSVSTVQTARRIPVRLLQKNMRITAAGKVKNQRQMNICIPLNTSSCLAYNPGLGDVREIRNFQSQPCQKGETRVYYPTRTAHSYADPCLRRCHARIWKFVAGAGSRVRQTSQD